MTNANLTNAILNGANLTGANMKGAIVTGLKFNESTTWPDGKKGSQGNPVSYTT
ncbi:MAG: pentapeptide repeat-containing protein [Chloroflexi bacterium]|nr:pentapeptide repeat-containing protein [Chloroflexota bacterium]